MDVQALVAQAAIERLDESIAGRARRRRRRAAVQGEVFPPTHARPQLQASRRYRRRTRFLFTRQRTNPYYPKTRSNPHAAR